MANPRKTITSLIALTAACQSQALDAPSDNSLSYRYSQYQQTRFPESQISSGSADAIIGDFHQLQWKKKLADDWLLNLGGSQKKTSGAHASQTSENDQGVVQTTMSGASVDEQHLSLNVASEHYFRYGKLAAGIRHKDEKDLSGQQVHLESLLELNSAQTVIGASFAYGEDKLDPTDPQQSEKRRQAKGKKRQFQQWQVSLSQVLNKYEIVRLSYGQQQHNGLLDDPYRDIDSRPDLRKADIVTLEYRFYVKPWKGAIHSDYRYYSDNWEITSHTLKAAWLQDLTHWFRWRLEGRVYQQQQALFYSLDNSQKNLFQSNDPQLSGFGSLSYAVGVDLTLRNITLSADWRSYFSREKWGPDGDKTPDAPELVNYNLASFAIRYRY